MTDDTKNSLIKFFYGEASAEDMVRLSDWIKDSDNKELFDKYVQSHVDITTAMLDPNIEKIKEKFFKEIGQKKKRVRQKRIVAVMKYAAFLVFLFGVGYFSNKHFFEVESNTHQVLIPKKEAITIESSNGSIIVLDLNGNKILKNEEGETIGNQNGSRLVYRNSGKETDFVYNTIRIPYGKRFDVVLGDGTHVFLNAGSSLKYPTNFSGKGDRVVFLSGEAFFDVAHNARVPFKVLVDSVEIEVLGTEFNISNYPGSSTVQTVLIGGSVKLTGKKGKLSDSITLEPGFKGEWDTDATLMAIDSVDTRIYTAWMEGKLVFRNTTFKNIRQALERKYNVTINSTNREVDQERFDATFDIESIGEVLESFNRSYAIKYSIKNNEVIIE